MNLLRLLLILLLGWLLARWVKLYIEKRNAGSNKPVSKSQPHDDLIKCALCGTYVAKGASHICKPGNGTSVIWLAVFMMLFSGQAQANIGGRYLVEVIGSHISATLEVNGVRIEKWSLGSEATAGSSFNHWLKQGNNTLVLKAAAREGGRAQIRARIYFLGTTASGAVSVVNLLEINDMAKATRGASVSFNLASAPSLSLWQVTAAPEPIAAQQATVLVGTLRSELISVMAVGGGFEDVKSLEMERTDLQRAFGGTATSQPLAIAPQSPQSKLEVSVAPAVAELAVDSVGATGLLRISRKDGTPLVALRRSGQVVAVPAVLVGWINGAWHILRRVS